MNTVVCSHPKIPDYFSEKYSPLNCGEDSYFINENSIGIADGVGGWRDFGISSKHMATHMMYNASTSAKLSNDPSIIMKKAYEKIKADDSVKNGSTTCCIITLTEDYIIKSANIGDSGFIIIRNGSIVSIFPTIITDKKNIELGQISIISDEVKNKYKCEFIQTPVSESKSFEYKVEKGDIIILATDGLWDNLPGDSNLRLTFINSFVTSLIDKGTSIQHIAKNLVKLALNYNKKPDDITVLVSEII